MQNIKSYVSENFEVNMDKALENADSEHWEVWMKKELIPLPVGGLL